MSNRKKRRRFLRRGKPNEEMVLQITSMADIFTILLVFLLKSFSTGISNITPNQNLTLPIASARENVEEALKIEVSENAVMVDDHPVTSLKNFAFDAGDLEANGTPRSLNSALIAYRSREHAEAGKTREPSSTTSSDGHDAQRILVLADQKTPYSTLKSVMTTAAIQGFGVFKLVVVEDR